MSNPPALNPRRPVLWTVSAVVAVVVKSRVAPRALSYRAWAVGRRALDPDEIGDEVGVGDVLRVDREEACWRGVLEVAACRSLPSRPADARRAEVELALGTGVTTERRIEGPASDVAVRRVGARCRVARELPDVVFFSSRARLKP